MIQSLSRYKFTIIYGIVSLLLGGVVLAVPALFGGLLVDRLMSRPDLEAGHGITKYTAGFFIFFCLFLMLIYPIFLFDWALNVMMPFTDRLAAHIPAVDKYGELVANLGHHERVQKVRHLFAAYWFWGLIISPLLYGDIVRWLKIILKNNFFTHLRGQEIPGTISDLMHKDGLTHAASFDKSNYVIGGLLCSLPCLLISFGILYLFADDSFNGAKELSEYIHNSRYKFTWLPLLVINLPAMILAFIISAIILSKRLGHLRRIPAEVNHIDTD